MRGSLSGVLLLDNFLSKEAEGRFDEALFLMLPGAAPGCRAANGGLTPSCSPVMPMSCSSRSHPRTCERPLQRCMLRTPGCFSNSGLPGTWQGKAGAVVFREGWHEQLVLNLLITSMATM